MSSSKSKGRLQASSENSRYKMLDDGLYWFDPNKSEKIFLSAPFKIIAETRNSSNHGWGLFIEWPDNDQCKHEWILPRAMLAGDGSDVRALLLDRGFHISPNRKARDLFFSYLGNLKTDQRVRCVDKVGWYENVYVLPDEVIGDSGKESVRIHIPSLQPEYNQVGSLEGWQKDVAKYAIGNSRLAFSISMGFVGPLLEICNEDSFGIHLFGKSSDGKTTALRASASVGGTSLKTWRATDNATESWACASNDGLLVIDELSQADGRAVDAIIYMLGNGQGKGRMKRDTTISRTHTWKLAFISSGELGISEKLNEVGRKVRAGQSVRMIEFSADGGAGHGIFEDLHNHSNGAELSKALQLGIKQHQGHALKSFLNKIIGSIPEIKKELIEARQRWVKQHLPPDADGQVIRVAACLGLVAAAGELAVRFNILPWPHGEAEKSAARCFQAWLEQRGGSEAAEILRGIEQVRAFIELHGASRFIVLDETGSYDEGRTNNRIGYRRKDTQGRWEYLVLPEGWKNEVCAGVNSSTIAKALATKGWLVPGNKTTSKQTKIPGLGNTRVYLISGAMLDEDSHD